MKWHHVQENWAAFYEAIIDKWPEAEDTELDEIDGDQRAFIAYLVEVTGQEPGRDPRGAARMAGRRDPVGRRDGPRP